MASGGTPLPTPSNQNDSQSPGASPAATEGESAKEENPPKSASADETSNEPSPDDSAPGGGGLANVPARDDSGQGGEIEKPTDSPTRKQSGGRVLLPGGQAWNPPKAPAVRKAPQGDPSGPLPNAAVPVEGRLPQTGAAPAPTVPDLRRERDTGVIYWTGRLQKNRVIVIQGGQASAGTAQGDFLPGVPADVKTPSPVVVIVDKPGPDNDWRRVSFRCLKSTDGSVTVNLQWYRLN